jgi:hypothetical protein
VSGGWRTLHNEELRNLYASQNIIRVIKSRWVKMERDIKLMAEMRNANNILVGKTEEKRPLGRPRRKWDDNIRIDLKEIGWEAVD